MRWLLALALLGGCYSPSIAPCRLACANADCPDGLACNSQGMCAETPTAICSSGGDDGGGDGSGSCSFPMISNVDACALGADEAMADIVINTAGVPATINTDTLSIGNISGLTLQTVTQTGTTTGHVVVAVVRSWTHMGNITLDVTGARPLIIVANGDVSINGPINLIGLNADATCATAGMAGGDVTTLAGGGGGGGGGFGVNSLGSAGAPGGIGGSITSPPVSAGGAGGNGGPASSGATADELRPLTPGCPGGKGGVSGSEAGGLGGLGGGAIQISSRTRIRISSPINARGGGGQAGAPITASRRSGGGGGGAGGAILLEAPMLELTGGALCANGGGGGGAGAQTLAAGQGQPGTCNTLPAAGGAGMSGNDGTGGNGATGSTAAIMGVNGVGNSAAGRGGGGGGGSVGRIRINGMITSTPTSATPVYTTGSF